MALSVETLGKITGELPPIKQRTKDAFHDDLLDRLGSALKQGLHPEQLKKLAYRLNQNIVQSEGNRRVVFSGPGGVISPVGNSIDEFYNNMFLEEKTGFDDADFDDTGTYPVKLAARVKGFNYVDHGISKRQSKSLSRLSQFAVSCARQAKENANLDFNSIDPYRCDVIWGSGTDNYEEISKEFYKSPSRGYEFEKDIIDPLGMYRSFIAAPSAMLSLFLGAKGYVGTNSMACTSGLNAIGTGFSRIKSNLADIAFVGGGDCPINKITMRAFCAANLLSYSDDPRDFKPMDSNAEKHGLGEGAAVFVLEELNHALERNAPIVGEVVGFNNCTENVNEFFMLPKNPNRLIELIKETTNGSVPDHVSAHAPGDKRIDELEIRAIKEALGKVLVTSIKGSVGQGFASGGVFQVTAALISLIHNIVPPTLNLENPVDSFLEYAAKHAIKRKQDSVLVLGRGLGGFISALFVRRHET